MECSAIFHSSDKRMCYALEKGKFLFRLKTKKNDIKKVVLHIQDKYIGVHKADTRRTFDMIKAASDRWNDYYEVIVEFDVICLRYYFEIIDTNDTVLYYGNNDFFEQDITDNARMFDCPQNLREEERFIIPEWAKGKVVYQIFPARFATDKDVDKDLWYKKPIDGWDDLKGNLRGIINKLDYIKDIGIEIIYMTPIFKSDSTHKYDTIDYYQIDPSFGTEADLKELVDKAHEMGIRVILDGVFNHTSQKFFAFEDINRNKQDSEYFDWYYINDDAKFPLNSNYQNKNYKCFAYYGGMPKLNLKNEKVREYVIDVVKYWMEKCNIDGWRLDVGDEVGHDFWKYFRKKVREIKEDALIVGEIWHYAGDFLEGDEWDSVMNYDFFLSVIDFVAQEKITATRFMENMGFMRGNVHIGVYDVLLNLIDSHDTARFLHICKSRKSKLKLAAALQLLLPGMPMIYYGDECALNGGHDPDNRRGMLWDEEYQDTKMLEWYKALISTRKNYPCITQGNTVKCETDDENGLIILEKEYEGKSLTMIFHCKNEKSELAEYKGYINVLTGKKFGGIIKPYEAVVLEKL